MTEQEQKARQLLKGRSVKDLVEQFEITEALNSPYVPTVRGWLMDELERRNPKAYEAWMDSWDDSPRKYFLKGNS